MFNKIQEQTNAWRFASVSATAPERYSNIPSQLWST